MNYSKISVRYAKALFTAALEENKLELVRKDSELINETMKQTPEISEFLESLVLDPSTKIKGLEIVFKAKVQELTMNFLRLVVANRREDHLDAIFRQYDKQYKEHKNIRLVKIRSAHSISKEEQDGILALVRELYPSELEVKNEIQEDLIGGFVMQIEDQQIDASVSRQLNSVRKKLSVNHSLNH